MKVVLLSNGGPLADAMRAQFASRGRELVDCAQPAELCAVDAALRDTLIIDARWLSPLQRPVDRAPVLEASLLKACAKQSALYLLLTDGSVFDGAPADSEEFAENAIPAAASDRGRQLIALEEQVLASAAQTLILRTGVLVAASGDHVLADCVSWFRQSDGVALRNTRRGCPTPVSDLARVVSGMVDQLSCGALCRGVYHYNSSGSSTAFEFAEVSLAYASQFLAVACEIAADDERGSDWQPWIPPLVCDRILRHFGIKQLPWRAYLPKLIKSLCEEEAV